MLENLADAIFASMRYFWYLNYADIIKITYASKLYAKVPFEKNVSKQMKSDDFPVKYNSNNKSNEFIENKTLSTKPRFSGNPIPS